MKRSALAIAIIAPIMLGGCLFQAWDLAGHAAKFAVVDPVLGETAPINQPVPKHLVADCNKAVAAAGPKEPVAVKGVWCRY